MSGSAFVAIDFGTTQTTAASWVEGGAPTMTLLAGRQAPMPSAVFHDGRELLAGPTALRSLQSDPLMGERTPKRKLRHYSDWLQFGDHRIDMFEVVGCVLSDAYAQALDQMRRPPDVVCLTRPVTWSPNGTREKILRASAVLADITCPIKIITESEAAAQQLGAEMNVGESCLVYDIGAGTCDIALMEMTRDGLELRAEDEQEIGGETFDERLLRAVLAHLESDSPQAARQLEEIFEDPLGSGHDSDVIQWRRCAAQLGENVRRAKIRLSRYREAAILIPPPVSKERVWKRWELERLVREDIAETAESARACVEQYGKMPTRLYLAGAASAMPAVGEAIAEAIGLRPNRPADPKAATVLGGLRTAAAPLVEAQKRAAAAKSKAAAEKRKRDKEKRQSLREQAAKAEQSRAATERAAAAAQRTEELRKEIRTLSFGKPESRAALAAILEVGEIVETVARCVPPGSVLKNGMYLITNRRLVWARQTWSGQPTVDYLSFGAITAVQETATNSLGVNLTVKAINGHDFLFKEIAPGDAPRLKMLATRR